MPQSEDLLTQELQGVDTSNPPSGEKNNLKDEILEHHRQRRCHKRYLFWGASIICIVLFGLFCYAILFSELPLKYLEKSAFSLIPLSILGAAPVIIIISLFRCVFRPGNTEQLDKSTLEIIREIISFTKITQ